MQDNQDTEDFRAEECDRICFENLNPEMENEEWKSLLLM